MVLLIYTPHDGLNLANMRGRKSGGGGGDLAISWREATPPSEYY